MDFQVEVVHVQSLDLAKIPDTEQAIFSDRVEIIAVSIELYGFDNFLIMAGEP